MSRNNDIWLRKPAGLVLGLDFSGDRKDSCDGKVGTLTNGATVSGRTLVLDGVNDYLEFGDLPEFSFTNGSGVDQPGTVGAWVKRTTNTFTQTAVLTKITTSTALEWQLAYPIGSSAQYGAGFALYHSNGSARIGRHQGSPASISTAWVHLMATYSGSELASGIKVFLNSVQVDDTDNNSGSYTGASDTTAPVRIGALLAGASVAAPFPGLISDVRIYNRVLTAPEIAQIYNAGAARIALGGTP